MQGETPARVLLDAWRVQGADRLDPVRFHFMAALERRTAAQSGEARGLLVERLSQLVAAYADELERNPCSLENDDDSKAQPAFTRSALADLVEEIARRSVSCTERPCANNATSPVALPELEALDDFRQLWSTIRSESQLRHSLADVPANAGPLNSGSLVHRSFALMRELSPGYLQHFLSYIDSLSWLDQMNHGGVVATRKPTRAGNTSKRKRSKPA